MNPILRSAIISMHKRDGLRASQIAHEMNIDEQEIQAIISESKWMDFPIRTTNYGAP